MALTTLGLYGTIYNVVEDIGSSNPSAIAALGTGTYFAGLVASLVASNKKGKRYKDPYEDMKSLDQAFINPAIIEQDCEVF